MYFSLYNFLLLLFTVIDCGKWLYALLKRLFSSNDNNIKRDAAWGQKFGLPIKRVNLSGRQTVMIHCASMGEVVAAANLIKQLLLNENLSIVVTTNTLTGKQQVKRLFPNELNHRVFHQYLPVDLPWLVTGLLKRITPKVLVIMEVELWPNLLIRAKKQNIKTVIVNARMTDKTAKGYHKFSSLSAPMLASIDKALTRNDNDFDNYQQLGVSNERLVAAGNLKFDLTLPELIDQPLWRHELGLTDRVVLLAGSTHDGEETLVLNAYKKFKQQYPNLVLVITPRHPHRFEEVKSLINNQQLNMACLSETNSVDDDIDVLLVDKMGVLSQLYQVADIVFVGGSFVNRGGHNPIEASVFAKPVLMGPHIHNNPEIINTLADAGGLKMFASADEFETCIESWLAKPQQRVEVGDNGRLCIKQNQGALTTAVTTITHFLDGKG